MCEWVCNEVLESLLHAVSVQMCSLGASLGVSVFAGTVPTGHSIVFPLFVGGCWREVCCLLRGSGECFPNRQ